jgi:LysM repeat protein
MRRCLACLLLLMAISACGQKATGTAAPATVVFFDTATSAPTPSLVPPLTLVTLPTPTIITYTVVKGDTLSQIARQMGVTVDALLAANPGVSPTTLSVGTKLAIPTAGQVPQEPTPTPAQVPIRQAQCWPEASGGLWCLALVQNDYAEPLENLSAQFSLLNLNGHEQTGQIVYGLLDLLPPGAAMPLAAHFSPPEQAYAGVRAQVLTAIRLLPGDTRYLPVSLENTLVSVDASGRTAEVSGRVILKGAGSAATLWVLATAYDASGLVVGVRRWEAATPLTHSNPLTFDFQVSSLGPEIARVEFLAEARP